VKDILAYLQLTDNPSFNPAFIRAIKAPARGMGDKVSTWQANYPRPFVEQSIFRPYLKLRLMQQSSKFLSLISS
jgi:superfamily I DNA/RNA helicase